MPSRSKTPRRLPRRRTFTARTNRRKRRARPIERGLEPLADIIEAQELTSYGDELTAPYIDAEKNVPDAAAAIAGACDIIAERISDDAAVRKSLRDFTLETGRLVASELTSNAAKTDAEKAAEAEKKKIYETYFKFDEAVAAVPSHRVLAVNRGEKENCLKVGVTVDDAQAIGMIAAVKKKSSAFDELIDKTIQDSYDRLIKPSIEREVRTELFDRASEQAIKTFERNLKPLLLQPPLKGKVILGLDPAYRTGCKIAVIDASGKFLDKAVIYPTAAKEDRRSQENSQRDHRQVQRRLHIYRQRHGVQGIGDIRRRAYKRARSPRHLRGRFGSGRVGIFRR